MRTNIETIKTRIRGIKGDLWLCARILAPNASAFKQLFASEGHIRPSGLSAAAKRHKNRAHGVSRGCARKWASPEGAIDYLRQTCAHYGKPILAYDSLALVNSPDTVLQPG